MRFEEVILTNLMKNEDFCRKVIPHLQIEYFKDHPDKILFKLIKDFITTYNKIPTRESIVIELMNINGLKEREYEGAQSLLTTVTDSVPEPNLDWLMDKTESWCQSEAVYQAVLRSVKILDGTEKSDVGSLPSILQDALSVSFSTSIGHDFFEDVEKRYDFYHTFEERLKCNIDWLNEVTGGGLPRKTLNLILAPTNAGKTLLMCSMAADYMRNGYNVLYITLEMAEERISERIDSNLMSMSMDEIKLMDKAGFIKRLEKVKENTPGKLLVKEYPTASAHSGHFRHLIQELKTKKKYVPDVIFVDYVGICLSQRAGKDSNSYTTLKAVSEELRGLASEFNVVMISSSQTNKGGIGNGDLEMTDIADSTGQLMTADFIVGWIRTEELDQMRQAMMKVLKSRYGSTVDNKRSLVAVDYDTMTVRSVNNHIVNDSGYTERAEPTFGSKTEKKDYGSIQF